MFPRLEYEIAQSNSGNYIIDPTIAVISKSEITHST